MKQRKRAISPSDPLAWAKAVCTAHPQTPAQNDAMISVKDAAVVLIVSILQNARPSNDRATSIRKVREALMFAKEAINLQWEDPE